MTSRPRRAQGLLGVRLQPRDRAGPRTPARGLDRGRGHRAAPERRLGDRLPDAEGPEDGRHAQGDDRAEVVRPARPRPRGGRGGAGGGPGRAVRAEGRARAARDADRARRPRRPSPRARAPQAQLAAEGLFAPERKRRLPRVPRAVGILTGADAAARGDLVATIGRRFPAAKVVVAETRVQGMGAPAAIVASLRGLAGHPRSTSSSSPAEEAASRISSRSATSTSCAPSRPRPSRSCPPSGTSRTRRSATSPPTREPRRRPRLERSSSPTSASSPPRSRQAGAASSSASARSWSATSVGSHASGERLRHAPPLLLERRRSALDHCGARLQALSPLATLGRGYAIVRAGSEALREAATVSPGEHLEIQLAVGELGAVVDEVRP